MSALVWFRRDLRLDDHTALHHALVNHDQVHCAFVFDRRLLERLNRLGGRVDRRVSFMIAALAELDAALRAHGSALLVCHGLPEEEIPRLAAELGVDEVLANRDYEPASIARDEAVAARLAATGHGWRTFKDQVIFECNEVMTQLGTPFGVFTPYRNAWFKRLQPIDLEPRTTEGQLHKLAADKSAAPQLPTLQQLGFKTGDLSPPLIPTGMSGAQQLFRDFIERIDLYDQRRDFPAIKGPSYLSAHLRFGTVSIRQLAGYAHAQSSRGAQTWLSELIWRDFYHMILWQHPRVVGKSFKPAFDAIQWEEAPELFSAWCEGRTGYPLVDAAMRQLNTSGYMHNRLRMVTASFMTKDLGVDWRLGERYFGTQLIDYDLAANNGGWQWAASTGCDAQPWFRIFNPVTQSERFDCDGKFIRRYVTELSAVPDKFIHAPWTMTPIEQQACGVKIGRDYPAPVVDHASARQRTLARFGALKSA